MASFGEHVEAVKAAIEAAREDGCTLDADLSYDRDGMVDLIQIDLWSKGEQEYVTVFEEDRR